MVFCHFGLYTGSYGYKQGQYWYLGGYKQGRYGYLGLQAG